MLRVLALHTIFFMIVGCSAITTTADKKTAAGSDVSSTNGSNNSSPINNSPNNPSVNPNENNNNDGQTENPDNDVPTSVAAELKYKLIHYSPARSITDELTYIISDMDQYNRVWKHHLSDEDLPKVDFESHDLIALFQSAGDGIEVTSVKYLNGEYIVSYNILINKCPVKRSESYGQILQISKQVSKQDVLKHSVKTVAEKKLVDNCGSLVSAIKYEVIHSSPATLVRTEQTYFVSDLDSYYKVWKTHFPEENLPKVDFDNRDVIALLNNAGDGLEVTAVYYLNGIYTVNYNILVNECPVKRSESYGLILQVAKQITKQDVRNPVVQTIAAKKLVNNCASLATNVPFRTLEKGIVKGPGKLADGSYIISNYDEYYKYKNYLNPIAEEYIKIDFDKYKVILGISNSTIEADFYYSRILQLPAISTQEKLGGKCAVEKHSTTKVEIYPRQTTDARPTYYIHYHMILVPIRMCSQFEFR